MATALDAPRRTADPASQVNGVAAIVLAERALCVPPSAHTLAGFRAWAVSEQFPDRGRISFLDQEIFIDMSPEELETHVKVKTEIGYALIGLNKKTKRGDFYANEAVADLRL